MELVLEQQMEPLLLIINDYELARIRRELDNHIFNEGQTEKLKKRYQNYLYNAEHALKKGTITKDEYLTVACFYLFPVTQLNLPFAEEKKRFFDILKNNYEMQPSILLTFEEEDEEEAIPLAVPKKELQEQHLLITTKNLAHKRLDELATQALNNLERAITKEQHYLKERYVDAFGLVKVTPTYFDLKNEKLENRYEKIVRGTAFNITAPYELE